jgi:hypothetical protein
MLYVGIKTPQKIRNTPKIDVKESLLNVDLKSPNNFASPCIFRHHFSLESFLSLLRFNIVDSVVDLAQVSFSLINGHSNFVRELLL